MKVSIITAVLNRVSMIADCLSSVGEQTHPDVEHIVVDGGSTDGTLDVIRNHRHQVAVLVSDPDEGIYHALNEGIARATGHVVGILGADDAYASQHVIETVVRVLGGTGTDSCYGDLLYVRADNPERVVRYWVSSPFSRRDFRMGWMPAHPTFFARREVYERFGSYDTSFRLAADYELMLRFLFRHGITTYYIPEVLAKMRTGGMTSPSLLGLLRTGAEELRAWRVNGLVPSLFTIAMKKLRKLPQFVKRPSRAPRSVRFLQ